MGTQLGRAGQLGATHDPSQPQKGNAGKRLDLLATLAVNAVRQIKPNRRVERLLANYRQRAKPYHNAPTENPHKGRVPSATGRPKQSWATDVVIDDIAPNRREAVQARGSLHFYRLTRALIIFPLRLRCVRIGPTCRLSQASTSGGGVRAPTRAESADRAEVFLFFF